MDARLSFIVPNLRHLEDCVQLHKFQNLFQTFGGIESANNVKRCVSLMVGEVQ